MQNHVKPAKYRRLIGKLSHLLHVDGRHPLPEAFLIGGSELKLGAEVVALQSWWFMLLPICRDLVPDINIAHDCL